MDKTAEQTNEMSLRKTGIISGFAYLMIFVFSITANFFVFEKLIVSRDPISTISNIIANESLFRFGIACWVIVVIFDVIVAWGLYLLLKPINKSLSLLAAYFRVVFSAIFGYSFVNYFAVLKLLNPNTFDSNYLNTQIALLLNTQYFAVRISYVFFGIHIFLLGLLILKSKHIPRILGFFLVIASCGYLIDSFGNFLSSAYANNGSVFMIFVGFPALISEFSLTVWLLLKGGKEIDKKI
ncbi:MAG: DUF4386 domain-containing protein [Pyrinomonadaceae bacterium]|nr:DUF4386 domain-containing protein [Pyrinomonadaceae bacterium]